MVGVVVVNSILVVYVIYSFLVEEDNRGGPPQENKMNQNEETKQEENKKKNKNKNKRKKEKRNELNQKSDKLPQKI